MDNTYAARAAFLGKLKGYTARFAGLLHALDYADRLEGQELMNGIDKEIPGAVMQRAVVLAKYFLNQFDVRLRRWSGGHLATDWVAKIVKLGSPAWTTGSLAGICMPRSGARMLRKDGRCWWIWSRSTAWARLLEAPPANQAWWQAD